MMDFKYTLREFHSFLLNSEKLFLIRRVKSLIYHTLACGKFELSARCVKKLYLFIPNQKSSLEFKYVILLIREKF